MHARVHARVHSSHPRENTAEGIIKSAKLARTVIYVLFGGKRAQSARFTRALRSSGETSQRGSSNLTER